MDVVKLQKNWWRNGFELGLKQNIYIIDNFITPLEAQSAIDSFGSAAAVDGLIANSGEIMSHELQESHPLFGVIKYRLLPMASSRFGRRLTLYLNPYLRKYPNGLWLGRHCDSEGEDDNGPLPFSSYSDDYAKCPTLIEYSVNIYLNDNYDGGEINFTKLRHSIKPEAGQLIMHPSGIEYSYEVSQISNGDRYSLAAFLTTEKLAMLHSMVNKH